MKYSVLRFVLATVIMLAGVATFAQVGINKDHADPDGSAMLDVKSTEHGILIPRMGTEDRDQIPSPAPGLLIYNTATNLFNYYNGSYWCTIEATFISSTTGLISSGGGISINATPNTLPDNAAMLDVNDPSRGLLIPRTTPDLISAPALGLIIYNISINLFQYYDGSGWKELCATSTGAAGATGTQVSIGVAINTDSSDPDPSSILDVTALDKGILIPRLTYVQRDQILPVTGLVIYNTSSNTIQFFNGSGWYNLNICSSFTCGQPFTDARDNKTYTTVQIGAQCWMRENLNVGTMIEGINNQTDNDFIEKYCHGDNTNNCDVYGGLYQWEEMMQYTTIPGSQGICPAGWHLPTDGEYCSLASFLDATVGCETIGFSGFNAGNKLKEGGTTHWDPPNHGATNESGFTGLPGGYIVYGNYDFLGYMGHWWTSSTVETNHPLWMLVTSYTQAGRWCHPPEYGFSVRCIRNCDPQPTKSDAGPDQLNLPVTAAILQGNAPDAGTGQWSIISGTGGVIINPADSSSFFTGISGNEYTLRWTITTECGSSSDDVVISFALFSCGSSFVDARDNKTYNTVQIGLQCWMKENLNIGTMINGSSDQSDNNIIEKYCYNNIGDSCTKFGGFYQWNELMQYASTSGVQGLCPDGWHLPTDEEWCTLSQFVDATVTCDNGRSGTDISGKLRSTGGWYNGQNGTDSYGFTALPSGYRYTPGSFIDYSIDSYWWTSTQYDINFSWTRGVDYYYPDISRSHDINTLGLPARCVRNCDVPPTQSDAGPDQLGLTTAPAILQGNTPTTGTGLWSIVNGTGGVIAESSNPASNFTGIAGNSYTLRWTITTSCGSSSDDVVISFSPYACGLSFTDARDNKVYNTVRIGTRCWMKENLNTGNMILAGVDMSNNSVLEKYCYDDLPSNCDIYGGLYQWNEMMQYNTQPGTKGICPDNWHLPDDIEWNALLDHFGGAYWAGGALKETGTTHWQDPNEGATNSSGFTALPGGYRHFYGYFDNLHFGGQFWSSSYHTGTAGSCILEYSSGHATYSFPNEAQSFSVRCIRDCMPQPTQSDAGPDQLDLPGTAAILQGNAPVAGTGQWSIISGTGGVIDNLSDPFSNFTGISGNEYTLRWTITTECGSSSDDVVISFAEFTCGYSFVDTRDNKVYNTVQIGPQCWMKENLNTGTIVDISQGQSNNSIIEKNCYNNNEANCDVYGGLYQWTEMMQYVTTPGVQGICPDGWHIPADGEWTALTSFLGGENIAGGMMKTTGTLEGADGLWHSPNSAATNSSGFSALPGGYCYLGSGESYYLGYVGLLWSSTENSNPVVAWNRKLLSSGANIERNADYFKSAAMSVRCLKDCTVQPTQSNAGPDQLNIQGASATLQGNTPLSGTGQWSIISGTGGVVVSTSDPGSIFNGLAGNSYTLRWTISTICSSSTDDVAISFAAFSCNNSFMDTRDTKIYQTVLIGTQCWFAQNLNVGTKVLGSANQTNNSIIEKYCYDDDENNCNVYGGLYQWDEAMQYSTTEGVKGICPTGWHLPTDAEWTTLTTFLGGEGVAGGKMKETGTTHWLSPNTGATNSSGFTALPGSERNLWGNFYILTTNTSFWSSSKNDTSYAWYRILRYNYENVVPSYNYRAYGFSSRCLQDCDQPTQSNAGPDQLNIQGASTTLQGNTPTAGNGIWSIVSGTGGSITTPSSPVSTFTGVAGNSYTLRWTISTYCASTQDEVTIVFSWECGQAFMDTRDSKIYQTVLIGPQCWFAQNLNVGTKVLGSANQTNNSIIEKYCYDDDENNCNVYGGLYQWDEAMQYSTTEGAKGICPTGWHLPTDAEWTTLTTFLGGEGVAGGKMKETGTTHWASPNTGATNSSGFTALPGGLRYVGGFYPLVYYGFFWTSSQSDATLAWDRYLYCYGEYVGRINDYKTAGFSGRCVKDCDQPTQSNAGPDQLNILGASTSLQGNTPTAGTGLWSIVSGTGGSITIPSSPSSTFTGVAGNSYTLRWTISTYCASSQDDVVISFWGCGQTHAISHIAGNVAPVSKTVSYSTVTNIPGETSKCWITSNLGSDHQATAVNDITEASAGWYWQFNRKQGYKHDGTTRTPNTTWITPITESLNWQAANDPCNIELGIGWRIPTSTEWTNVDASGGWTDWNGPWNSGLKMHSAGYLGNSGGSLFNRGSNGDYWSSTQFSAAGGYYMTFGSSYSYVNTSVKAAGYSLRCIKDCDQPTQSNAGPDQLNIIGTSSTLAGNTPTSGTGLWSVVSGTGGNIANPSSPTSNFTGLPGNSYTLRWTITATCGSNHDDVVISFWSCGQGCKDTRDSKTYQTVLIGTQCWFAQNINVGTKILGTASQTNNSIIEKYCYNDDENNCNTYGGLYQWNEAMQYSTTPGVQGICPTGWHLPTDAEWTTLTTFLGGEAVAGGKMKETGTTHWASPNTGATNSSGFTALPGGIKLSNGDFSGLTGNALFWSSSQLGATSAWILGLSYGNEYVSHYSNLKTDGFSSRCVKDN